MVRVSFLEQATQTETQIPPMIGNEKKMTTSDLSRNRVQPRVYIRLDVSLIVRVTQHKCIVSEVFLKRVSKI